MTLSPVPAVPPNVTDDISNRFVPVIVTGVPPATTPLAGDREVIVGGSPNVKSVGDVAEP